MLLYFQLICAGLSPGSLALVEQLTDYILSNVYFDVSCTGRESSILQCIHDRFYQGLCEKASVMCQGNANVCSPLSLLKYLIYSTWGCVHVVMYMPHAEVGTEYSKCTHGELRLGGGGSGTEGRIELCYNHVWGTVCNEFWKAEDASVVCKQLGLGGMYVCITVVQ